MACSVSGVRNISRKLSVNFRFRESNLFYKFPAYLNKLHCHLNAPQIGKTIFNGFSYFPPLHMCFHHKMVMLGTSCNHSSTYPTWLSTANLKFFKVSLTLNNASLIPCRPLNVQTLTGVISSVVCQRTIIQRKWSNLVVFCHIFPGVPWTLSFLAD